MKKLETEGHEGETELFFFQPELETECFLPPNTTQHRFTLVLDLDETLVHYEENGEEAQFLVRPYAQQFLAKMGKYFEIVIFTAAVKQVNYKLVYLLVC